MIYSLRAFSLALLLLAVMPGQAQALEKLRILAWEGYADPDIVKAFEQRYAVRAEVTTIDSDLDLWKKISTNNRRPPQE